MKKERSCNYAFDFDGVIAKYDGFKGKDVAGEPVPEVVEAIRELKKRGHKIIVYGSTRDNDFLKSYCEQHDIPVDYFNENPEVPNSDGRKPVARVYIDDRGLTYKGQSVQELVEEIENFEPYWKNNKQ
ncbi:hypothetical protein HYX70_04230 [Candidatus Saccharibacteria bacterium]|nr:hypothetical protein [Candidatus Saccharibacteria bacterium]